jgi:hypothetical protein
MLKFFRKTLFFGLMLGLIAPPAGSYDLGLATRFSDVILENLDIGQSYNFSALKNLPLTIINTSNVEAEVQVDVQAPTIEELKEGYEPIPDPSWVRVIPDRFKLPPAGRNLSDIILTIPNDPSLKGRHFQVMFWPHTLDSGFYGVGVRVRIRFSVGAKSPEAAQAEAKRKKMMNFDFRLDPTSISLSKKVPLGRKIDLVKETNFKLKLVNTGPIPVKLFVRMEKYINPQRPPAGYEEIPDLNWFKIKNTKLNSKPDTIEPISMVLEIPDKPEFKGKKYAALAVVGMQEGDIPINIFSQILFTTEE